MRIPSYRKSILEPVGLAPPVAIQWQFSTRLPGLKPTPLPPPKPFSQLLEETKPPVPPRRFVNRTIQITPGFLRALTRLEAQMREIRPKPIYEVIEPETIGVSLTPEYFRELYGLNEPPEELTDEELEQLEAEAVWIEAQEAMAFWEQQEREARERAEKTLVPDHTLSSGVGGGGSAANTWFLGSAVRAPSGWTPIVIQGGNQPKPSINESRYSRIQQQWNRSPANTYPWQGRPAVQAPKTVNGIPADSSPVPRNAAYRPQVKPNSATSRAINDWNKGIESLRRSFEANQRGLINRGRLPLPGNLRPVVEIASKPTGTRFFKEAISRVVPFLRGAATAGAKASPWTAIGQDFLFPEPAGDLTPERVARLKGIKPPTPRGQSPGGTKAPRQPKPPDKPARRMPIGSSAKPYRVEYQYWQGVNSETVLVSANPTIYKARFLNWLVEGKNAVILTGPLTIEWIAADPAAVANFIDPPSPWKHILIRHSEGVHYISQGGQFSTGIWAIYSLDDIPEPFVPGGEPYIFDPPPEVPETPQEQPRKPPAITPGLIPGTGTNPGITPFSPPFPVPDLPPGIRPPIIPAFPPIRPNPNRGNPLNPNSPTRRLPRTPIQPGLGSRLRPPRITPPFTPPPPVPGVPPARTPCTPRGEIEPPVPCRFTDNTSYNVNEILRRIGNPGNEVNGLTGLVATNEDSLKNVIGKPQRSKAGKIIPITDYLRKIRVTQLLMQALNTINLVVLLHNAAMLSRNLVESVGDMLSMTLQAIKVFVSGGTTTDDPIDVNQLVGQGFQGLMTDIFGKAAWTEIQAKWININRIITSAANVAYTIQGIFDGARNIIEITSTNVARIGNALKNSRVVNQGAFPWMNPNINSATGRFAKLQQMLDNSTEIADIGTSIASEVINISEESKELADNTTRFNQAVVEGETLVNDAGQLVDKDGKIIRDSNKQQGSLAESARRVSQGSEFSTLDMLKGETPTGGNP